MWREDCSHPFFSSQSAVKPSTYGSEVNTSHLELPCSYNRGVLLAGQNVVLIALSVFGAAACWLKYLAGPRRYLAVLPSNVRPSLFAGD
jgi:hypothetical protein